MPASPRRRRAPCCWRSASRWRAARVPGPGAGPVPRSSWARRSASSVAGCCRCSRRLPARRATRRCALRDRCGAPRPALRPRSRRSRRSRSARRASSTACTSSACCRARTPASSRATGWSRTSPPARRSSSSRGGARRLGAGHRHGRRRSRRTATAGSSTRRAARASTPTTGRLLPAPGSVVNIEDYERDAAARADRRSTSAGATAGSSSARRSAAARRPSRTRSRARSRTTASSSDAADVVFHASPYAKGAGRSTFNFDWSFNYYPLAYARPGPGHDRLQAPGRCMRRP